MVKQVKVIEFEMKSTDDTRQTIEAVRKTVKLSADLQAAIEKKYPGVKVKIKRAEGLPVHELVHHLLVSIDWHAVASGSEKAVSAFATTEFLKMVKKRVRNMFAAPVAQPEPPTSASSTAAPKKKPAKKSSTAKNVTTANKVVPKKASSVRKSPPRKSAAK